MFRTKNCEIKISFDLEIYDLDAFKEMVADWDDTKQREVALAALELGQKHIDLTPEKKKIFNVSLTEDEIEDLICDCSTQISDYCFSDEKEKSFQLLIEKLKTVKGDN